MNIRRLAFFALGALLAYLLHLADARGVQLSSVGHLMGPVNGGPLSSTFAITTEAGNALTTETGAVLFTEAAP